VIETTVDVRRADIDQFFRTENSCRLDQDPHGECRAIAPRSGEHVMIERIESHVLALTRLCYVLRSYVLMPWRPAIALPLAVLESRTQWS
jgi:hypothetical protein